MAVRKFIESHGGVEYTAIELAHGDWMLSREFRVGGQVIASEVLGNHPDLGYARATIYRHETHSLPKTAAERRYQKAWLDSMSATQPEIAQETLEG